MEENAKEYETVGIYKGAELRALIHRRGNSRIGEILKSVGTRKVEFQCVRETHGDVNSDTCYTQVIVKYDNIPYMFAVHYHPKAGKRNNPIHAKCLKNTCDSNIPIPIGGLFYNWLKYRRELSEWRLP